MMQYLEDIASCSWICLNLMTINTLPEYSGTSSNNSTGRYWDRFWGYKSNVLTTLSQSYLNLQEWNISHNSPIMASTSRLNNKDYYEILKNADFTPASYQEIAESLMENGIRQMYHALVNEADILTLFSIPNLKIFWVCRCPHYARSPSYVTRGSRQKFKTSEVFLFADDRLCTAVCIHSLVESCKRKIRISQYKN